MLSMRTAEADKTEKVLRVLSDVRERKVDKTAIKGQQSTPSLFVVETCCGVAPSLRRVNGFPLAVHRSKRKFGVSSKAAYPVS